MIWGLSVHSIHATIQRKHTISHPSHMKEENYMKTPHYLRESLMALCLCLIVSCASEQLKSPEKQFTPQTGQEGKDVIWVPTPYELVEKMLDLAEVTPDDYVIDLGSGDGRTVIAAAKRGVRALGIEYNPDMVELSKQNAKAERVSERARFIESDLFETDFSKATVITMFLLTEINLKLRPQILDLKPGTRIVSSTFRMGEWTPDDTATVDTANSTYYDTALLWIVPAKVVGTWRFPEGTLTLKQEFQMISGTLEAGGSATPIENGRLRGDQLNFSAGGDQYTGSVNGKTIEGTVIRTNGKNNTWNAVLVTN